MRKLFGTDGVRGVANRELTVELAMQLGRAGAYVLAGQANGAPKVLLGTDTRRSGDMLEAALSAGLCSLGAQVYLAGDIPTPGVAYLVRKYGFDAGVMISASHNPMGDNGIKFFNSAGRKLSDELELEIEKLIDEMDARDRLPRPEGIGVGVASNCPWGEGDYASFLRASVPDLRLGRDFIIALDCANGATSKIAMSLFQSLGALVYVINNQPDGININNNCGSTHMDGLKAFVKEKKANIGLAFDGDGDRMLAVDENGNEIDGDVIMAICTADLHERGLLKDNTLVGTIMSNQGLDIFCNERGINLFRTDVGDRYVLEKMLTDDLMLGGEQSGHVIFRQFCDTGDGMLTGLQLLGALARSGKPFSQLANIMTVYPQVLVNAKINGTRKSEIATHHVIVSAREEIETKLAGRGRILVRPSGTEPLVRVMIEGEDKAQITEWAQQLAQEIGAQLT
ncbi:MAG: phosphoglucosamine mutase [Defluviitaleaceae bacterium]|nr:phosphoglucosamine mutase [Defluviitaleaceae bacterium]